MKKLQSLLQQSGIVGAGGAGFPTYAKLDERADTLILNCAECEPLLRLHRQVLETHATEIIDTFHQIGKAVGAKKVIIGIKKAYKKTIEALEDCIDNYEEVELGLLDEVYPAGDEVVLIYELTGKVIRPGGLPIESGIAVFNVETIYNAYQALKSDKPVTEKYVSIVGEVTDPVTVKVPIGCTMDEAVALAGTVTVESPVYFIGGPMMGFIGTSLQPVTKTTNAILVLSEDHVIIKRKRSKATIDMKRAAASCCYCSMCTDLCPRNLLGHPIEPHKFMQAATCKDTQQPSIFLNTMFCSSCGLCEMYSCMQGLSPRTLMTEYKNGLRKEGIKAPQIAESIADEKREYRKVPMDRLMARLDLCKYDKDAPLCEEVNSVKRVKILLSQHIGAPSIPCVAIGELVKKGEKIGKPGNGLSVATHASISGKIIDIKEEYIIIECQEGCVPNE